MYCPKCGTSNPENGKFCRSCGADIANVPAAMSGNLTPLLADLGLEGCGTGSAKDKIRRSDPNEVFGDAVKSVISGIGFMIVSFALFTTGVAGGKTWWWVMLFPAFTFLAKGIADLMKSRRMERSMAGIMTAPAGGVLNSASRTTALPPQQTDFVRPESRYKTGDLVPHSVTDETTRHLEVHTEGETITLPKPQ
jgi:hypothetical protein